MKGLRKFLVDSLRLYLLCATALFPFSGCAEMANRPNDTETCGDVEGSPIGKMVANPEMADLILQFNDHRYNRYMSIQTKKIFNKLKSFAATADTYQDLALFASAEIKKLNAYIRSDEQIVRSSQYLQITNP